MLENYPESYYFKDVVIRFFNEINGLLNNLYCEDIEVLLVCRSAASIFKVIGESNL